MIGEMRITSPKYPRVPTQQAIDKAFEKVEDNPITNKCEHFVNFVRYHRTRSKQVKLFIVGDYFFLVVMPTILRALLRDFSIVLA
jgi:hypothetical protein